MTGLGPFEVAAKQVEAVGAGFTQFVNQLLQLECLRVGMLGHQLRIDSQDESPDGGVDAELLGNIETTWLPVGRSAWQFKRGDLKPAKCREELRGAAWARDLLEQGAVYRLVLGKRLTPEKIERRQVALVAEAAALGLPSNPAAFIILDANRLAAWASQFPALAVSQLLGGPGFGAQDFELWSRSNRHQTLWTPSDERQAEIDQLRGDILSPDRLDIRVRGVSGIGKTRLVLEAVRGTAWQPLVAYVPAADELSPEFLNHALAPTRAVVLIVDECESRRHEKLAERIPVESLVRLVTIGHDAEYALRAPVLTPRPLANDALDEFLKSNYPALGNETRRFVTAHADGNVRWAMVLAERSLGPDAVLAAELIQRDDIAQFTTRLIPEGRPFFLAAVLALFERVGWDRDLRPELTLVADFVDATVVELDALSLDLEQRGLIERQGRYRAIVPHPLAVVLAADAWTHFGARLVTDLMPRLNREMALSFLTRVTHLGTYEPAREALLQLIRPNGPFGSLNMLESSGLGDFLTRLAIVLPEEITRHLGLLIASEPIDSLQEQKRMRRDLVWTLEKLVWHSRIFEEAADSLLRLAIAENETYGNNATGIWSSLFAAALPATAASPAQRIAYLIEKARSDDDAVKTLVVKACKASLHPHESVMVSGENQGGVLVEPRGSVRDVQEALAYRRQVVEILNTLYIQDGATAALAAEALVGAIHPLIAEPIVGPALGSALRDFRNGDLVRLRKEIERLRGLFRHHPKPSVELELDRIEALLPEEGTIDRVRLLTDVDPWSFQDDDHREELQTLIEALYSSGGIQDVLEWLQEREIPSGWHLGHALADLANDEEIERTLVEAVDVNLPALAGFLSGRVSIGVDAAFEQFFESSLGRSLSSTDALAIAVRGPADNSGKTRVLRLLHEVSVHDGAIRLFGWQRNFDANEVNEIVRDWLERMQDQFDYTTAIDWMSLWFHDRPEVPPALRDSVERLVLSRRTYPELGHQAWHWARLARVLQASEPTALARAILDLVTDGFLLNESSEEAELLATAAVSNPDGVWRLIAERLEAGDWRLAISLRGWITRHLPVSVLRSWVNGEVERARLLAQVASAGQEEPSPEADFLLTEFGADDEVQAALAGEFSSGVWIGNWSGRIQLQSEYLTSWQTPSRSPGVRAWAHKMKAQLQLDLISALEREAEDNRN